MNSEALLPAAAALLATALTMLYQIVRDGQARKHEQEREREARDIQREQSRDAFQRETLIETQDVLQRLTRATGATHVHDEKVYRLTGEWGKPGIPEEHSDAEFQANTRLMVLESRILDDELRTTVRRFRLGCVAMVSARSREEADAQWQAVIPLLGGIQERIGTLLRAHLV